MTGVSTICGPVMIVDDDALLRKHIALITSTFCSEVLEAPDGAAALELLEQRPLALVITDLVMPRVEGVELIQSILECYPETAVLAISGGGRARDTFYLKMATRLGADAILQKPFRNEDLREAARNAWFAHQQLRQAETNADPAAETMSR